MAGAAAVAAAAAGFRQLKDSKYKSAAAEEESDTVVR
jgi:hypothetical protein